MDDTPRGQRISALSLLVPSYEAGIAFYVGKLGFDLLEDTDMGAGKRWVRVRPKGGGVELLLACAVTDEQRAAIGNQSGGRVFLFLETDDFDRDHAAYVAAGVTFLEGFDAGGPVDELRCDPIRPQVAGLVEVPVCGDELVGAGCGGHRVNVPDQAAGVPASR